MKIRAHIKPVFLKSSTGWDKVHSYIPHNLKVNTKISNVYLHRPKAGIIPTVMIYKISTASFIGRMSKWVANRLQTLKTMEFRELQAGNCRLKID